MKIIKATPPAYPDLLLCSVHGIQGYCGASLKNWHYYLLKTRASLVAQNLPAMWQTWVRSLGGEEPLEEHMAPHSSVLAWRIPWTEEPGGPQSTHSKSQTGLSD